MKRWCVFHSDGTPSTLGATEAQAIDRHLDWIRGGFSWAELRRRGARCEPVEIVPAQAGQRAA